MTDVTAQPLQAITLDQQVVYGAETIERRVRRPLDELNVSATR
jgi:hypothetical protein